MQTLSASKRIEIKPGAVGTVLSKENVSVCGSHFAIMDIRNTMGRKSLFLTSSIIKSVEPWDAPVEIHIANLSPNLVEIMEGEEIVNVVNVKEETPKPSREATKGLMSMRVASLLHAGQSMAAYANANSSVVVTKLPDDFAYNVKVSGKDIHGLDLNIKGLNPVVDTILNHIAILESKEAE